MRSPGSDEPRGDPLAPPASAPDPAPARAGGDPDDFTAIYDALRQIATAWWRRERRGHTLQPTAVVHECWLKLSQEDGRPASREEFLRHAAAAMRRVLVEHARRSKARRRGGDRQRVDVPFEFVDGRTSRVDLLALDEALSEFARMSERQAQVVELRFFGGMTEAEAAAALSVSVRAVSADWKLARFWLREYLFGEDGPGG